MLIKQLNNKSAVESKELFAQLCLKLQPTLSQNITDIGIRDSISVIVQKSLNLVGEEMLEVFEKFLEVFFSVDSMECLDAGLRLAAYAAIEVGEAGFPVVDRFIPIIFAQAEKLGFPDSDASDADRDRINVFGKLLRLLSQCTQRSCSLLLAPNTIGIFEKVVRLLLFLARQGVEKHLRKEALVVIRTILTEFGGCTLSQIKQVHVGDKTKIEERKI